MIRIASCAHWNAAVTFTFKTDCSVSRGISSIGDFGEPIPAFYHDINLSYRVVTRQSRR